MLLYQNKLCSAVTHTVRAIQYVGLFIYLKKLYVTRG
jgi:hypothetical protein